MAHSSALHPKKGAAAYAGTEPFRESATKRQPNKRSNKGGHVIPQRAHKRNRACTAPVRRAFVAVTTRAARRFFASSSCRRCSRNLRTNFEAPFGLNCPGCLGWDAMSIFDERRKVDPNCFAEAGLSRKEAASLRTHPSELACTFNSWISYICSHSTILFISTRHD